MAFFLSFDAGYYMEKGGEGKQKSRTMSKKFVINPMLTHYCKWF